MDYADVFTRYHDRLLKYLSGIVGASEAEDVVQEVFVKVGKKLPGLRDPSKLSSWIFKIALNTARDRLRQRSAGDLIVLSASCEAEPDRDPIANVADSRSRTAEEGAVRSEMIQCYLNFVRQLPRNYYDVYVLSELEELPDKAICERLSLPLETVKMRLHRARAMLYQELRAHCRCYYNERGEIMGDLKQCR
jgi:RNA polymerase sigma-70 factor (ECF subfamily)